ncbi:transposase of ISAar38, IS5 family, IS427 group [Arthrobacter sp. PAMC 25486]|nr:transposase of ISAar38, IS5 family, IS427 group [Arthrobacter sp. PAMC 25486]
MFDKLVQVLARGAAYERISDSSCSATTIRRRRDAWIIAGIFTPLEQIALESYDRIVRLEMEELSVDGCLVKSPCGGEASDRSPADRGKQGTKRSVLVEAWGIPRGVEIAGANRHDSPLLRPTLEKLSRFGFFLPEDIRVHLEAGYDSNKTRDLLEDLGCEGHIATKGVPAPIQNTSRWDTHPTRRMDGHDRRHPAGPVSDRPAHPWRPHPRPRHPRALLAPTHHRKPAPHS